MTQRTYSTRRYAIVDALVEKLKEINGSGSYVSNVNRQVFSKLRFFEEVRDFPTVCVVASNEIRDYQAGGYRDRYLDIRIMIYVNEDNPLEACEALLEDIETVIASFSGIVVVDEAYIEFADSPSFVNRLADFPNLVVCQTFSKAQGMAGVRLGMTFAHPEIIHFLKEQIEQVQ